MNGTATPATGPAPVTAAELITGTTIIAPYWERGRIIGHRRALVVENGDMLGNTVLVWFYTLGDPNAGTTLQLILPREAQIIEVGGYTFASLSTLRKWRRHLNQSVTGNPRVTGLLSKINQVVDILTAAA